MGQRLGRLKGLFLPLVLMVCGRGAFTAPDCCQLTHPE